MPLRKVMSLCLDWTSPETVSHHCCFLHARNGLLIILFAINRYIADLFIAVPYSKTIRPTSRISVSPYCVSLSVVIN